MNDLVLGDSLDLLIDHRGKTPKKLGGDFVQSGVPVASALLVRDGRLDLTGARHVTAAMHDKWMPERTRRGDVILTSEAPAGRVARIASDAPLVLGQRLFCLRGRAGVLDSGYLYYALQYHSVQRSIIGHSTGTTVTGIRQSALRQVRIPAPSLAEQEAIAEVLSALDDKIAANSALAAIADQYVRTEYLGLSRGSRVRVGHVAVSPREGVDPDAVDPSTVYVGLEHIPRKIMWLADAGTAAHVMSGKSKFDAGDILFGKLRPYFHKVVSAPTAGICSTDVLVVRAKDPAVSTTLLAALSSNEVINTVVASSEGTRMPRTSWKDLAGVEIHWPKAEQATLFDARLSSIRSSIYNGLAENRTLMETRDSLLPALMSGKMRVRDVEQIAADARV